MKPPKADDRRLPPGHVFLGAAALLGAVLVAYWLALRAGFIWDDDTFVTGNPLIHAANGLRKFWFSTEPSDYWPVTSTVLWFEWRLWGMNPLGYHAVNLLLHGAESVLLWSILRRLRVPGAFLAALFFAVHPVNVESVAWIAETKNTMAMLFYLASIRLFLETEEEGGGTRWIFYGLSLFAFVLGLLSKGSVATLPFVLAGVALWRRPLRQRDGWLLAPFFASAVVMAGVNVWFQGHYLTAAVRHLSISQRVLGAGAVIWFYLCKAVVPWKLLFVYPDWAPQIHGHDPRCWCPLLAAAAVTSFLAAAAWPISAESRAKRWFFAWIYFCVSLVPVLGLTDIYFMKFSPVADHYQHLAIIGVVTMAGWAWAKGGRHTAVAAAAVVLLVCLTWNQCRMYRDIDTLYATILEGNPDSWFVQNNYGLRLHNEGRDVGAKAHLEKALSLKPDYADAHSNLGLVYDAQGHPAEALAEYREAVKDDPSLAPGYNNLGLALASEGRLKEGIACYAKAAQLNPYFAEAFNNMGNALQQEGDLPKALAAYARALKIRPDYAEAHYDLANGLEAAGRRREAIAEYDKAVELKPGFTSAWVNRGNVLLRAGRKAEGIASYERALQVDPDDVEANNNLGAAYVNDGRFDEAVGYYERALKGRPNSPQFAESLGDALAHANRLPEAAEAYEDAIRLKPDYAEAYNNLGGVLQEEGRPAEAVSDYERAVRVKPDYPDALRNLGSMLYAARRLPEAASAYERALRLKPDSPDVLMGYGNVLLVQGRPAEAIPEFEAALRLAPGSAEICNNLGVALDKVGRVPEAIARLEQAIRLKPDYADAQKNLRAIKGGTGAR